MTVTKACIVDSIFNETSFSKKRSAQLFDILMETMKQTLETGDDILIRGLGKFSVRSNNGHRGRNSASNGDLAPEVKRVVIFRCSPALKKKMNGEAQD